jgi:hypothetical protein
MGDRAEKRQDQPALFYLLPVSWHALWVLCQKGGAREGLRFRRTDTPEKTLATVTQGINPSDPRK